MRVRQLFDTRPARRAMLILALFSVISVKMAHAEDGAYLAFSDIEGESTTPGQEGAIELLGWRWQTGSTAAVGSGRTRTAACISTFEVDKLIDSVSVPLLIGQFQGRVYPRAILTIVRRGETGVRDAFFTIELSNVIVTDVDAGQTDGASASVERVGLRFESATLVHENGSSGTVGGGCAPGGR